MKKSGFSAALLAAALLGVSCSNAQTPVQRKAGVAPVRVAIAMKKDLPLTIEAVGNMDAYSVLNVVSQVNGEIKKIHFKEGEFVKKGDPLITIDPRPFEAALAQARGGLERDTVQMDNAKREVERNRELLEKGFISASQFDQLESAAKVFAAAVVADKAAVENAKLQLAYCHIDSPITGQTGAVQIYEGNQIKANDKTIVTVMQVNPIYADFPVAQKYLPLLNRYRAKGRIEVVAYPPGDAQPEKGTLSFMDNTVDPTTGTIKLKAEFANTDQMLWPGQFVKVSLLLTVEKGVVAIPTEAVNATQKGLTVYVANSDGTASMRPVQVERTFGNESIIASGIQDGEKVITDGQLQVIPGGLVKVIEEQKRESGK